MKRFERFLTTNPDDAGCDETRRFLHVYAEAILAGTPWHPGIDAHLRDCPPCADELEGLLAAITGPGRAVRTRRNLRLPRRPPA